MAFGFRKSSDTATGRDALAEAEIVDLALPILWLLGKTGAGKSTLIRELTGLSLIEIGNGFQPCTMTSQRFDYPPHAPLLRFLDTRGLGEASYDPAEDLAACAGHSHIVLVVCRLDDPVQGEVADALGAVLRRQRDLQVLVVHTGADLVADPGARDRALHANRGLIQAAAKRTLPEVVVAMPPGVPMPPPDREALTDRLLEMLPAAGLVLARQRASDAEERAFQAVRPRVLFYAGLAGVTDVAPIVGAVSVPATQMAMLRELGQRYKVPWTRRLMANFIGALGVTTLVRFGGSFGLRQLGKLIPVVGQTAGAALAGSLSFAATYALGRVAAQFLHARSVGETPTPDDLQDAYRAALKRASGERN
jgi:uncharacterized protein (DUF697 family)